MAQYNEAAIFEQWSELRKNPVFLRRLSLRGAKAIFTNPVVRMSVLTFIGLVLYELLMRNMMTIASVMLSAVMFWWFVNVMHYYFVWLEVTSLRVTGTLHDYLNSGLSRADVAMGLIMPGKITKSVSQILIVAYFMYVTPNYQYMIKILLGVIIFLEVSNLLRQPVLFLPDVQSYFRVRNPLALVFIGLDVFVPLVIWFGIYYLSFYLISVILGGVIPDPQFRVIIAFIITYLFAGKIGELIDRQRLKAFQKRFPNGFEQLIDQYLGD